MVISLIGFMGCGKSSVGKALAGLLSCRLTDLDTYIEEKYGRTIPEIFSSDGEKAFREMEKTALSEILDTTGDGTTVISTGGGTAATGECAGLLKKNTMCIYLKAGIDTLVHNLENDCGSRPMLHRDSSKDNDTEVLRQRILELMELRESAYCNTAEAIIMVDGKSFMETASEIRSLVEKGTAK